MSLKVSNSAAELSWPFVSLASCRPRYCLAPQNAHRIAVAKATWPRPTAAAGDDLA